MKQGIKLPLPRLWTQALMILRCWYQKNLNH